jgi:putative ABC transport system permease protein
MIRHLLVLVWNRRRASLLLMIEIWVAFLMLVAVSTLAAHFIGEYRQPLGFSFRDVWTVSVRRERGARVEAAQIQEVFSAASALPQVEAVAGMNIIPFASSRSTSRFERRDYSVSSVTDTVPAVMGVTVVHGRWFGKEDDGASDRPVVVNERFARAHFGTANAVGRRFDQGGKVVRRVVGVVRAYRQDGELGVPGEPLDFAFERLRLDGADAQMPDHLMVKLRPGTTAEFEERLMAALHGAARSWSFKITPLEDLRREQWKKLLTPLIAIALIAGFFMMMVALGLTGVVWQSVTRRTREIGLRRAQGATAGHIRRQLVGELVLMASLAMAAGGVVVAHFPALHAVEWLSGRTYLAGFAISVAAIYFLVVVCGSYPARLATRIQPFEALRYE